jgi:hypothetical protein
MYCQNQRGGCTVPPWLPIITLAHLYYRKRNSFWDCGLLSEKRACSGTHSSESGCIRFFHPTYCVSLLCVPLTGSVVACLRFLRIFAVLPFLPAKRSNFSKSKLSTLGRFEISRLP